MTISESKENGVVPWVLAAAAHSFLMTSIIFLLTSGTSTKSAATVMLGEFLVLNIPLYLLIARSRRAWRAKQRSSKAIWILGSTLGGGNLALASHLLTPSGAQGGHIEKLLLVSTLIVTVTACCAGVFVFAKISDRP